MADAAIADTMVEVAGEWRYERIEDASHWLMLDRPGEVNDLQVAFRRE